MVIARNMTVILLLYTPVGYVHPCSWWTVSNQVKWQPFNLCIPKTIQLQRVELNDNKIYSKRIHYLPVLSRDTHFGYNHYVFLWGWCYFVQTQFINSNSTLCIYLQSHCRWVLYEGTSRNLQWTLFCVSSVNKRSKLNLLRIYRYIKVRSYASLITSVIKIKTNNLKV
jgi:hypothetical protein